jgi:zinc protease
MEEIMAEIEESLPQLDTRRLPGPETILRRVLSNGITVLARENFTSPSVVISGYLSAGSLDEKPEQAGLAYLTAQGLMRGTTTRSFQDIFESIESIGARVAFVGRTHTTRIFGKALAEDLSLLLDVIADVLQDSVYPDVEFERLKAQHLTSLAIRDQDTQSRADMAFDELAYPNHPYRLPTSGYRETVQNLRVEDLREFRARRYSPEGMLLVIVGAIEAQKAVAAVSDALEDWKPGTTYERPPLAKVERPTKKQRKDVYLDGKSQSDLVIGVVGPSRYHEKYLAAALGNNILGRFGLFGRLGEAVRKTAGLAYYAYSSLAGGLGPGPWRVNAGVHPANIERTIQIVTDEIRRFSSQPVTREELHDNQANFIGSLPLRIESNEGLCGALIYVERYDLGLDYYQRYPDTIAAITREDVLEVAREFLDPERLVIATAGPKAEAGG